jgi:hypothetical protein
MNLSFAKRSPLTPALSPEYWGEGARSDSLSRLRERVGVRVMARLNIVANQQETLWAEGRPTLNGWLSIGNPFTAEIMAERLGAY